MWFGKLCVDECAFKRGKRIKSFLSLLFSQFNPLWQKMTSWLCSGLCKMNITTAPASATISDISNTTFQISWQILPQRESTLMGIEKK